MSNRAIMFLDPASGRDSAGRANLTFEYRSRDGEPIPFTFEGYRLGAARRMAMLANACGGHHYGPNNPDTPWKA